MIEAIKSISQEEKERKRHANSLACKKYREKNKEKRAEYWKKYSAYKKQEINARHAARRAAMTPEERKKMHAEAHQRNKAKRCAYTAAYCAAHKEERKAKRILYMQTEHARMLVRHHAHVRRARLMGCERTATAKDVREFLAKEKVCAYCSRPFTKTLKRTLDHINPLKRTGAHSLSNFAAACINCNSQKQGQDPAVFARKIGLLFLP